MKFKVEYGAIAYFLDLFSPEINDAFTRSNRSLSGFRKCHIKAAQCLKPDDKLVCYMWRARSGVGPQSETSGSDIEHGRIVYLPFASFKGSALGITRVFRGETMRSLSDKAGNVDYFRVARPECACSCVIVGS